MTRELHYKIEQSGDNLKINDFLKQQGYSRAVIIELKKHEKGIRKNGCWATVNERLEVGDSLEICLIEEAYSDQIEPNEKELQRLYEDEDLLILNKPHNTPIHPSINNYGNTLANAVMGYAHRQKKPYVFRCMNRLDRDTTGVTIIAKNLLSASILSKDIQENQVMRTYVALVEGEIEKRGTVNLPIGRAEDSILKRQIDHEKGQSAITHYIPLSVFYIEGKAISLVALKLDTGRTHQIRVHMHGIGHPLLGDFLYNPSNKIMTRQALHGIRCIFTHPITKEEQDVVAPLPQDLCAVIRQGNKGAQVIEGLVEQIKNLQW